jgi:hypothetical protein
MSVEECKTSFGTFLIKTTPSNIAVGGTKFCVNITIQDENAELYWLGTKEGGCELHGKTIRGSDTVKMADLAFTSLRLQNNSIKTVKLIDDSGFTWRDGRGKPYKVNFLKGYLLLYQKTWYEDKFGAIMQNHEEYTAYIKRKENFYDPTKKPATFNFINAEAKEKLEPLYNATSTWKEFIDELIRLYDSEKYKLIFDWYRNAIYHIFDKHDIDQYWEIDISERPVIKCITGGSGKRGTRKNRSKLFDKYERFLPHTHNSGDMV